MFVKYQKAVCLSGALLALAATFASANAGTLSEPVAKIHGTILQESGVAPSGGLLPVPGASVWLINDATGQLVGKVIADRRGRFDFAVHQTGKYIIKASKRGSGAARQVVTVSRGDNIKTSLVLKK